MKQLFFRGIDDKHRVVFSDSENEYWKTNLPVKMDLIYSAEYITGIGLFAASDFYSEPEDRLSEEVILEFS